MRLYPPAWILGRQVVNTFQLGGYEIARGATLLMGQWVLQRDPRYWKNAEQFDPDRWSTETRASRSKSCYFPFGAGPRQCIGEGFAWMEGVLLLATLAQSWKLSLVPGFELELQPVITLRPKHGMPMRLWRR
jgi:cytochrome P450